MNEYRPGGFNILPVVIKNLIIINGLLFLAMVTIPPEARGWVYQMFALHSIGTQDFKIHQLVTHIFMHGSWSHVFSNMFSLWIFGSILENYFGPKRFLTFYMICGIGAALCYLGVTYFENTQLIREADIFMNAPTYENLLDLQRNHNLEFGTQYSIDGLLENLRRNPGNPETVGIARYYVRLAVSNLINTPMVGASGAVYGILFGAAYLFPNMLLYLYFLVPIRLKYIAGFMILSEIFITIQNNPGDPVAHFAHLGGVLISFMLLRFWARRGVR